MTAGHCGLVADDETLRLVAVTCGVCDADDGEPLAVGQDFEYRTTRDTFLAVRCRRCGLVYLNPRPALDELSRIYPPTYHAFEFSHARFGVSHTVRRWVEARRLARWCRELPPNARVLDVGCGDGFHLRLLRDVAPATWRLEGLDPSEIAVAGARAAGFEVHHGTLQDVPLEHGAYDLVLIISTIEHVDDPRSLLVGVRDLLSPGGRAVVVTDNVRALSFALAKTRHWGGYHFPRRAQLFTRATLHTIAVAAGFAVDRTATIVSPVNWVYTVHNVLADYGASPRVLRHVSLAGAPALAVFTVVNVAEQVLGSGGLLEIILRRPVDDGSAARAMPSRA